MKAGIGLLALLMGIGLYLYLSAENAKVVTTTAKPAREHAEQIAGVGMRESFVVAEVEVNGKVTGLQLKRIDPTGPFARVFPALRVDDIITAVGPLSIRDTDVETLKALLIESGARQQSLKIQRGEERFEVSATSVPEEGKKLPADTLKSLGVPTH